ncbi:MAG: C-GCAxxG-C-C family protein [Desulfocapsa sp.]|nr:C-GCAxxG-C-C family protein [Desulfocapsa sp.]
MGLEKINQKDENVIKAMGAFGGGIASSGAVCGTLLGAVATISSLHSRGNLDEKENPRMWAASKKLIKEFDQLTEVFGGSNCRDIARTDWSNKDEVRNFYSKPDGRKQHCIRIVGDFSFTLGQILEKELARLEKP